MVDLSKITKNGKAMFLAYDQGIEHGPVDFDDENIDPSYILDIGLKGGYTGIIFQKGVAEKYYTFELKDKLPLILKLNGKTNLVKTQEPYSPLLCTVSEAIDLGAQAVGYTVYVGSEFEEQMLKEFADVVREAHEKSLPVIGWMYPRGKNIQNSSDPKIISYSARIGLEVGADLVKVSYPGSLEETKKTIEAAGRTGVVIAGGKKESEEEFFAMIETVVKAGVVGVAVGRNVWQSVDQVRISEKLRKIIFNS